MSSADNKPAVPASRRRTLFVDMLRKIVAQEELTLQERSRRLYKAADKLLKYAAEGEEWAIKELANRMDGKSFQAVSFENPEGETFRVNLFKEGGLRGLSPTEVASLKTLLEKAAAAQQGEE